MTTSLTDDLPGSDSDSTTETDEGFTNEQLAELASEVSDLRAELQEREAERVRREQRDANTVVGAQLLAERAQLRARIEAEKLTEQAVTENPTVTSALEAMREAERLEKEQAESADAHAKAAEAERQRLADEEAERQRLAEEEAQRLAEVEAANRTPDTSSDPDHTNDDKIGG